MVGPAGAILVWLRWYRSYEQKALFQEPDEDGWRCHMVTLYHMMTVYLLVTPYDVCLRLVFFFLRNVHEKKKKRKLK